MTKFTNLKGLVILVCLSCIFMSSGGAQDAFAFNDLDTHSDFQDQYRSLKSVLDEWSEAHEVYFNYSYKIVADKIVNDDTDVTNVDDLESALEEILAPHNLVFEKVKDRFYAIYKKRKRFSRKEKSLGKLERQIINEVTREPVRPPLPNNQIVTQEEEIDKKVSGTVTSTDGEPLIGVNILVKGTGSGTVTDFDGNYTINVPDDRNILIFSYTGYAPQEINIGTRSTINVTLEEDAAQLDEVVVVGYGSQKKSDITGSVASVKSEDLTAFPAQDAAQTLQGRAAGVQVSSVNGQPGTSSRIRVRGGTSINASSDPLIVVDGLIGGVLPPPEDIASIEILKDASSTAIYGSRGANGVILVTTKKGASGKARVTLSTSYTSQEVINTVDLLNREQSIDYLGEALGGYIPYSDANGSNFDTDWQDEIFRTGAVQNYNLSVAGGNENVKYYVSGAVFDQRGIILNSGFERYSLTSNIDAKISERVSLGANLLVRRAVTDGVATQESSGGPNSTGVITGALLFFPDRPIRDANGDFIRSGTANDFDNPFAVATERDNELRNDLLQGNTYVDFKIIEGLNFRTTLGVGISNGREGTFFPTTLNRGLIDNGFGQIRDFNGQTLLSESYLTYNTALGNGDLNLVGGYSFQSIQNESFSTDASGFPTDDFSFYGIGGAATLLDAGNNFSETEIVSWYGRANYNLADKYLFTFTGRADGSSNFAANNKWAFFPSGAFAWRISEENFMSGVDGISDAKLRVSYGLTGNQAIGPYQSLSRLVDNVNGVVNGQQVTTAALGVVGNDELTWETTAQFNIGLNIGLFDGRINVEADYYRMLTEDLLFQVPLPREAGSFGGSVLANVGEVENKGFELTLNSRNLVGEFKWDMAFNISVNRNEILALPDGQDIFYGSAPGSLVLGNNGILREGAPVGAFFGFLYDGVNDGTKGFTFETDEEGNPIAGGETFRDVEGITEDGELTGQPDGILDENDQTVIGDPNPDFIWGLNNTFSYKGFDLNVFFQSSVGGDIYNLSRLELDQMTGGSNATTDALNRYTPSNTDTDVPVVNTARGRRSSSRFVEDGTFVRLRNISLGYTLPSNLLDKIGVSSARIYVSGQNLWTITDYKGFDPEVNYDRFGDARSGNLFQGLDYSSYPITKGYTVGLNVGF